MSNLLVNPSIEFLILIIYTLVVEFLLFYSLQFSEKIFHLAFYFLECIRHSCFKDYIWKHLVCVYSLYLYEICVCIPIGPFLLFITSLGFLFSCLLALYS